ncbi:hypothetical protein DLJ46_17520, partial [Micromonospora globispora]
PSPPRPPGRASGAVAPAAVPLGGTATPGSAPVPVSRPNAGPSSRGTATAQLGRIANRQGTTYTGASFAAPVGTVSGRHPTGTLVRRQG